MAKKKVVIIGAAGRDFHNFNTFFRDNADYEVVAFTAAQIPDIDGREYPKQLAGKLYKKGIPILAEDQLEKIIKDTVTAGKPIGALCISPVLIAKVLGNVELTIGQDKTTAEQVEELGARHINTRHGDVVVDSKFKIATTPCYMLDATIMDIAEDAENVVLSMLEMM